jgi:CDP-diacylglycerol--glycerol-3-phosphate 3-phosphatidyltransferase/cardiolipin synthase
MKYGNKTIPLTIPNLLTLLRIVLIPVYVIFFYLPVTWSNEACATIFALAAFTDWLDGYLARRLGQYSPFGAFLDPVADKLMVAVALVLLVEADPTPALAIPAVIIIGREITISALREWMAELGARAQVAVSVIGKMKTAAQMGAIFLLIYQDPIWDLPVYTVGYVLLYVAATLTLWSMVLYLRAALPSIYNHGAVDPEPVESGSISAEEDIDISS